MENKNTFVFPEVKVIHFDVSDITTTSDGGSISSFFFEDWN